MPRPPGGGGGGGREGVQCAVICDEQNFRHFNIIQVVCGLSACLQPPNLLFSILFFVHCQDFQIVP